LGGFGVQWHTLRGGDEMMAVRRKTTMGHITQDHLKQSKVAIPPLDLIKNFDKKLKPMLKQQH